MGTDRSGTYLRGILVPDPRITSANIVSKTDATVPSSYTEAGPFAGPAAPDQDTDLVLRTSGTQTADGQIEIQTHRSGGVGVEGAGFVFREPDGDNVWYGSDAPALVTGWDALYYTSVAGGANIRPHPIRLLSGKLLCAVHVSAVGVVLIQRFDPSDSTWTSVNLTPTGAAAGYVTGAATLCQLSSGRVLCFVLANDQQQVDMYYSDDDGTTWAVGGYRVLADGVDEAAVTDMRAAFSPATSEVLLLLAWDNSVSGLGTVAQYASADLGTDFTKVMNDLSDASSEDIERVDVAPMIGGGFCVLYVDSAATPDNLLRRRIGSAFDSLDAATAAEPDSGITPITDCTIWADPNGTMWFIVADGSSGFPLGSMYRSTDSGDTWEEVSGGLPTHSLDSASTLDAFETYAAASLGGRVALVTRFRAATSSYDSQSVGVLWYGGHSTHTAPARTLAGSIAAEDYRDTHYLNWLWFWAPAETPPNTNWTTFGAGSETLVSSGELEITTTVTSAAARNYKRTTSLGGESVFVEFAVEIDAGDGDDSASRIGAFVQWGDNSTKTYEVELRLDSAGYRVYDTNAAANVGALEAVDFTARKHVRVAVSSSGDVKTWWSTDAHARKWTEGPGGTGLTAGAAGVFELNWGHFGDFTDTSRWALVGAKTYVGRWTGSATDEIAETWTSPDSLRPITFPTEPTLLHDGVSIQAVSGPSFVGETQQIETAYEYGIGNLFPGESPSPSQMWRATEDNQAYEIVIDLEAHGNSSSALMEARSIGMFLLNSNLETVRLQRWSGAAWFDLLSLDSTDGFNGLRYYLYGSTVESYATTSSKNWSPHQMHAGDTIGVDAGEDTVYRKVVSNAEGGWGANTKRAIVRLDQSDIDGAEDADGFCAIRRRNFGGVAHAVTAQTRYLRVLIPAQDVYGGKYEVGQLVIGPVFVFGLQYGDGWSYESGQNREVLTRDSGVRSSRVRGPRRRAVEVSWADQPQDTTRMWDADPSPDFVTGTTGQQAVASIADTAYQVLGLAERTNSGDSPVVYLGKIDRGTGSHLYTLDPEWIYGRLMTETPSFDHITGAEGVSVAVRTNKIRIEEEV